jgi:hypothetical protein
LIYPTVKISCVFDTPYSQYELCIWLKSGLKKKQIGSNTTHLDCRMYQIHSPYWLWGVSNTQLILTVGCIKYTAHTDCRVYQIHNLSWLWDISNAQLLCIWCIIQSGWAVYFIYCTVRISCAFDTSYSQDKKINCVFDTPHSQYELCIWCIKYTTYLDCGIYQMHS